MEILDYYSRRQHKLTLRGENMNLEKRYNYFKDEIVIKDIAISQEPQGFF
jgi:hypothetical protein